ncbi:MAG: sensor histidine kinase [Planctomycetes bacterium]|nr:sensor histidine kinase [Planctomycetota bacterium]
MGRMIVDVHSIVQRWWRLAGLLTWAVVSGIFVVNFVETPSLLAEPRTALLALAYVAFGVAFWVNTGSERRLAPAMRLGLAAAQSLLAMAIAWLPREAVGFIFLVLVAGQLATLLPMRAAATWIVAQSAAMAWIYGTFLPTKIAVAYIGVYLGFQAFAYLTVRAAESEAAARTDLSRLNAELRTTQALLAESSRLTERIRIARDLHDVLGHHLTALCLNLEVAKHQSDGAARESIERAQDLAKRLLGDVRDVVTDLRGDGALDLAAALRALVDGVPRPRVHVTVPDGLRVDDPARAEALLRCAQEAITNAIRHADAENLWLEVVATSDSLGIRARDDGRGAEVVREGNGLAGMRERLRGLGGRLELESKPGEGFRLSAWVPGGGGRAA